MSFADPIDELVALLSRLPGVGERTATRLAFFVIGEPPGYAQALGASLHSVHDKIHKCEQCGNYGSESLCNICRDPRRDPATVCVVARVPDLFAIERSGSFRGRYHVLHKLLSPLDGVGPEDLDLESLRKRIESEAVREVIVATPLSVDGEATALYINEVLRGSEASISRIASGVPHGGELEFTDQITLGRALETRRAIE